MKCKKLKTRLKQNHKNIRQQCEEIDKKLANSTSLNAVHNTRIRRLMQQAEEIQQLSSEEFNNLSDLLKSAELERKLQAERIERSLSSSEKKCEKKLDAVAETLGNFRQKQKDQFAAMKEQIDALTKREEEREETH